MAASSPRKRFTECSVCRITLIFPGLLENNGRSETTGVRHCPVCGAGFSSPEVAADRPGSDDNRLEEFFARFS